MSGPAFIKRSRSLSERASPRAREPKTLRIETAVPFYYPRDFVDRKSFNTGHGLRILKLRERCSNLLRHLTSAGVGLQPQPIHDPLPHELGWS